jgi:energy-coupling factor transport system permease protein
MSGLNTRTKILMVLTLSLMALLSNAIIVLAGLTIIAYVLFLISRKTRTSNAKKSYKSIFILIISLMVIQVLFRPSGTLIWHWWIIKITVEGISFGMAASLRLIIIFLSAGYLISISYYDYLTAFQSWKLPYELSFLMASVLQFLPVLKYEFQMVSEALTLRGIEFKKLTVVNRINAYKSLVFPILGRAISSLKFRVISLEMRGFRLSTQRTSLHEDKLNLIDWVTQFGLLIMIVVFIFMAHLIK